MRNFLLGLVFGSVLMGVGYTQVLPHEVILDQIYLQQRSDWIDRQTYNPSPGVTLPTPQPRNPCY